MYYSGPDAVDDSVYLWYVVSGTLMSIWDPYTKAILIRKMLLLC